ncbi:MAG: sugar phosphate isomerase/epimerase [Anaerolineae bacterium]|nr:sugar phosphate isomerase/epimerase [Anaerolineae bacterium]
MIKSINLRSFPKEMAVGEMLRLAREAGFQAVEINLEPWFPYPLESSPEQLRTLAQMVEDEGLAVSGVYCRDQWSHPITSLDPVTRERGMAIIRRLCQIAPLLKTDSVLTAVGGVDNGFLGRNRQIVPYVAAYENAQQSLRLLAEETAGPLGVILGVENVWNKFLLSPLEMRRFIDEIGHPSVRAYFDVGNVLLFGYPEDWIRILGSRIFRVHFKDFKLSDDGTARGYTYLLDGDVNWPAVVAALREVGYSSYVTAEIDPQGDFSRARLVHETSRQMDTILSY